MTPLKGAQLLAGELPDARLEALPGAGHMTMVEEGEKVLAYLADFLEPTRGAERRKLTRPVEARS